MRVLVVIPDAADTLHLVHMIITQGKLATHEYKRERNNPRAPPDQNKLCIQLSQIYPALL